MFNPIRPGLFLGAWSRAMGGGGGLGWGEGGRLEKVPAAHNSKSIHGIEMKSGRVVRNHKLINLP